jgi:DNA-binding LacI/PurR family transcriptional regulator
MAEHGLPIDPDWIVTGNLTQRGGAEVVEQLLAIRPRLTAIICGNDLMAIGAINRIQAKWLASWEEISQLLDLTTFRRPHTANPPLNDRRATDLRHWLANL